MTWNFVVGGSLAIVVQPHFRGGTPVSDTITVIYLSIAAALQEGHAQLYSVQ